MNVVVISYIGIDIPDIGIPHFSQDKKFSVTVNVFVLIFYTVKKYSVNTIYVGVLANTKGGKALKVLCFGVGHPLAEQCPQALLRIGLFRFRKLKRDCIVINLRSSLRTAGFGRNKGWRIRFHYDLCRRFGLNLPKLMDQHCPDGDAQGDDHPGQDENDRQQRPLLLHRLLHRRPGGRIRDSGTGLRLGHADRLQGLLRNRLLFRLLDGLRGSALLAEPCALRELRTAIDTFHVLVLLAYIVGRFLFP